MFDPKKPITNDALKTAISALRAENTQEHLNAAINEMMRATLMAPAVIELGEKPAPDPQGRIQLPKNTKISFTMLKTKENKSYFIAFTDAAELRKWQKDYKQQTMVMRFDDYVGLLERNPNAAGFVINPFGDSFRIDAAMAASLKKQREAFAKAQAERRQNRIKPGDKVTIVEPTVYPDALLDPVCEVLKGYESVMAAYLQVMIVNETDKSYLLVLDGPKDDKAFAEVGQAAKAFLASNERKMDLNITVSATPLGQQGMRNSEPVYLKGTGRVYEEDDE